MKICKNCGKEIAEETRFCTYCGAKNEDVAPVSNVEEMANSNMVEQVPMENNAQSTQPSSDIPVTTYGAQPVQPNYAPVAQAPVKAPKQRKSISGKKIALFSSVAVVLVVAIVLCSVLIPMFTSNFSTHKLNNIKYDFSRKQIIDVLGKPAYEMSTRFASTMYYFGDKKGKEFGEDFKKYVQMFQSGVSESALMSMVQKLKSY